MRAPALKGRDLRAPLAGALALVFISVATACGAEGVSTSGDTSRGKQLFVQQCGGCHTLADAGTQGKIGPNLDDAFASDRKQGFEEVSIQQVVASQIRYPLEPVSIPGDENVNPTGGPVMPANLVTGDDVDSVAAYVASVAGKPGTGDRGKIVTDDGKQIFVEAGCGGCHTLAAAGTSGKVGPNLDDAMPPKALVVARVTNGKGAMPSFTDRLTQKQIGAVADYVSSSAGK